MDMAMEAAGPVRYATHTLTRAAYDWLYLSDSRVYPEHGSDIGTLASHVSLYITLLYTIVSTPIIDAATDMTLCVARTP